MALDRKPAALGRYTHCLMVVSDRPSAGKRIAEPEATFECNGIGGVGKSRGALIGGNDEVRIFAIMNDDICGMYNLVFDNIIGDR